MMHEELDNSRYTVTITGQVQNLTQFVVLGKFWNQSAAMYHNIF